MYRLYTVQCTYNFIDGQQRWTSVSEACAEDGGGGGGRGGGTEICLFSSGSQLEIPWAGGRCVARPHLSLSGAKEARVLLPKADRSFNRKELQIPSC
jgi:hypothetical protein